MSDLGLDVGLGVDSGSETCSYLYFYSDSSYSPKRLERFGDARHAVSSRYVLVACALSSPVKVASELGLGLGLA